MYCVLSHLGMEVILLSHLGHGDYFSAYACVLILCVEPFGHGPLEVISLSAFVLCVEPFGCGHQVWLSTVC